MSAVLVLLALPQLAVVPAHAEGGDAAKKSKGAELYGEHCAMCHGAGAEGGLGFARPIIGSRSDAKKYKSAAGFFEYLQFTMPFNDPGRVSDADKYSIVAFLLGRHNAAPVNVALDESNAGSILIRPDSPLELVPPTPAVSPEPKPVPPPTGKPAKPGKKKVAKPVLRSQLEDSKRIP